MSRILALFPAILPAILLTAAIAGCGDAPPAAAPQPQGSGPAEQGSDAGHDGSEPKEMPGHDGSGSDHR